jgi:Cytochrome c554 and c-prime
MRVACSLSRSLSIALALTVLGASVAHAQKYQYLGPNKCVNCHDHDPEKKWWEKEDGPPPKGHINALNQMETPKSAVYAKAIGLADPYDVKGSCVRCHATVFKGEANAGISCESCHGPGSGYIDVHQEKGAYQKALAVGLLDVVKKPQTWAPICMDCHVMDDAKLVAAGHPSGDDFDLGAKYPIVAKHFKNQPDRGIVAQLGSSRRASIIAKRGGKPTTAAAPAPAAPAAPPAAAPTPAAPPAQTPPAAAPAGPAPAPAPTPAPAAPPAPATPPAPAAPPPAAATPPGPAPAAPAPAAKPAPSAPAPRPAAPPSPRPTPPPSALPPSAPPAVPPPQVAAPAGTPVPAVETPSPSALPRSPAAAVAAVQGRAIALLDALLRRSARAPIRVTPPEPKTVYRGADAELLRLQEEVLRLALEALGTAPKPPDQK